MEQHERQQFDFLLMTAVGRYEERLVQRCQGADNALRMLREEPEGEGVWLSEFVDAILTDFLLDNAEGACFILRALPWRRLELSPTGETVEKALLQMARSVFRELLRQKTEEALEQSLIHA